MTQQNKKLLIWLLSLFLWAGTAWVVQWGMAPAVLSNDIRQMRQLTPVQPVSETAEFASIPLSVADFQKVWKKPLQKPLYDPPPPPPLKPVKEEPPKPPDVELSLTSIEDGKASAMLQLNNQGNRLIIVYIGDGVESHNDTAKIEEIKSGIVIIRRGEFRYKLDFEGIKQL